MNETQTPDLDRPVRDHDRCIVVHPYDRKGHTAGLETPGRRSALRSPEARLEEACGLAEAIGLSIAESRVAALNRIHPATLIGGGLVDELKETADVMGVGVIIFDCPLSPIQQRNLERRLNTKVVDRTQLILEIFADRARTKEGVLQVDLATQEYLKSRLVRTWTHLERQRGGRGFMAGPGERQIEADRRMINDRIKALKAKLDDVRRTRNVQRSSRKRVPYPVVALVGYTNAGKSTLFNRLTESEVAAENQLFATLDPTMRRIDLPSSKKVILSDTVGFVSDLPHELVAAFHATLEEVKEADLILHVRDIAHPDSEAQKEDVTNVLKTLGIQLADGETPLIEVQNKMDLVDAAERDTILNRAKRSNIEVVPISAETGEGLTNLLNTVDRELSKHHEILDVDLDHADGKTLSWLYDHGEVLEREDNEKGIHLTVRLAPEDAARFSSRQSA